MTAELALSLMALGMSTVCFTTVVALFLRKRLDYPTLAEHDALEAHVDNEFARIKGQMSKLFRYVEAVDEHTGANGHRVLGGPVHRDNAGSGK